MIGISSKIKNGVKRLAFTLIVNIFIIEQVKFNDLQNPIVTGFLWVRCNFDTGETLHSVLHVCNPEDYRTLVWTSVKDS